MRRFAALTMALALGLACAVLVSSCGGSGGGTLSKSNATELNDLLDQIEQQAQDGNCVGAAALAQKVATSVDARTDIHAKLRTALVDGFQRLQSLADQPDCGGTTSSTTSTTDTTTTESTPTQTTDTTPDTVTTPTRSTPTQTTPTQTTPTQTTSTTGGVGGNGGIGTP